MKKASGAIALLLMLVLVFSVFVGCGMFGKDNTKFRKANAFTVGNQKITVGKIIDSLNTYVNYGYSAEQALPYVLSNLYTQYSKIDAYLEGKTGDNYVEFLTDAQKEYVYKYIKYLVFTNFDTSVEAELEKEFTLKDKETEDTSRDFTTYDDWKGAATYTDYLVSQLFVNEDMDEYFADYYADGVKADTSLEEYTNAAATAKKLEEYNKRVDKDSEKNGEITAENFASVQEKVVKRYTESIEKAYETKMADFLDGQVSDAAASLIVSIYDAEKGRSIDGTTEAYTTLCNKLKTAYENAAAAKEASYKFEDTFVTDIEGLSDSSDIYTVPDEYEYIFVKNVLVPFSDKQKAVLSNLETKLGTKDSDVYKQARLELAAEIEGEDFLTEKDEDGNHTKESNLFTVSGDNVTLNTNGAIYKAIAGTEATETEIIDLMKRFNTDTAQHSTRYDYVVRMNAPDDYTAKWVTEFVDAAEAAYAASENGAKYGAYALCVSDYGVHIVFFTGKVQAHQFDVAACKDTSSREYQLFKTEYNSQLSKLKTEANTALQKEYYVVKSEDGKKVESEGKIKFDKAMRDLISELGITFDLDATIVYSGD